MQVIGILNLKGGSSKTTLTTCLAVRASRDAATAVVRPGPSSQLRGLVSRRARGNPTLLTGEDRASDAVEALQLNSPYDYVFLDGPTNAVGVTEDAAKVSALVVIPMKPSALDLAASQDCIELCQETGKAFLVVICDKGQYDGRLVDETIGVLKRWRVPVAKTVIAHRASYINAVTTGKTGPEKDKKAAEEIEALWTEVRAALRKAVKAGA